MKLAALVEQANKTYRLNLNENQCVAVAQRLKVAGHASTLETGEISPVLDEILSMADDVQRAPESATLCGEVLRSYRDLKKETTAAFADDKCPRCSDRLLPIKLVNDRPAKYCQACHITLPNRVEE